MVDHDVLYDASTCTAIAVGDPYPSSSLSRSSFDTSNLRAALGAQAAAAAAPTALLTAVRAASRSDRDGEHANSSATCGGDESQSVRSPRAPMGKERTDIASSAASAEFDVEAEAAVAEGAGSRPARMRRASLAASVNSRVRSPPGFPLSSFSCARSFAIVSRVVPPEALALALRDAPAADSGASVAGPAADALMPMPTHDGEFSERRRTLAGVDPWELSVDDVIRNDDGDGVETATTPTRCADRRTRESRGMESSPASSGPNA
eukprot:TRINITY_DN26618_c0_g1_i1.p2 TRINITY_DN26618_c0_g1~~TRINITY_DN26618_c0_g1_i1.p2  ORF type:complete len:264 (-),score=-33.21 TRINITY_DN26618_c0_g1_i1:817-1608(-)